ncbi:MAG: hypothetical protein IT431_07200 [Phycisphaerales bacterium]|nr:hypothetical protein [Phycisphaerales bacterium]
MDGDGDADTDDYTLYYSYYTGSTMPFADWNWDGTKNSTDLIAYGNDRTADSTLGRGELSYAYSHASGAARKGYAGYEIDPALTGSEGWESIYHIRHRVLLSQLGRWTKRDPLGYVDGVNLHHYASMPLRATDPLGLAIGDIGGGGGCVGDVVIAGAGSGCGDSDDGTHTDPGGRLNQDPCGVLWGHQNCEGWANCWSATWFGIDRYNEHCVGVARRTAQLCCQDSRNWNYKGPTYCKDQARQAYQQCKTPPPPDSCGSDGSGWVPDNPFGFKFLSCCQSHDSCYRNCSGRDLCDSAFLICMQTKCFGYSGGKFVACMALANTYYLAVRALGYKPYCNHCGWSWGNGDCLPYGGISQQ